MIAEYTGMNYIKTGDKITLRKGGAIHEVTGRAHSVMSIMNVKTSKRRSIFVAHHPYVYLIKEDDNSKEDN